MKKLFFTTLVTLLTGGLILAQSLSRSERYKQLPKEALVLLQKVNFGSTSESKEPTLRVEPLRLDSTRSFFGYALSAKDSVPNVRSRFQYPKSNVTVEINALFQQGTWINTGRFTETRDQLGRVVELAGESYLEEEKKYQPESKLLIYPRGNFSTLIDSVAIYIWNEDSNKWEKTLLQTNSYNAQNRLAREFAEITVDGLKYQSIATYTYNAAGKNDTIKAINIFYGIISPVSNTAMTYTTDGKLKEVWVSKYQKGEFVLSERETYAYAPDAYRHDLFERDETYGVWHKTQSLLYKLDQWNRIASLEKSFLGFDEDPDTRELVLYTYAVAGDQPNYQHLALEQTLQWDNAAGKFNLSDRKFYHYRGISTDLPDLEVKVKSLLIYPNPTQEKVQLSLEDDAQVWVFNALGQQLLSKRLVAGQSLDVMNLSRGIYYIVAQQEQILYTGKLIKQ